MLKYGSLVILLFFLTSINCAGQTVSPHFKTYTSAEGLSLSEINNVSTDNYGFLWVATSNGLNRFDGNTFTRYYASFNPSNGLAGNNISHVVCDSIMIWLAIKGRGLASFFDMAYYFISYVHHDDDSESLASNNVNTMLISKNKKLFVGTDRGLSVLIKESNKFLNFIRHPQSGEPLNITSISEGIDESIWIGTDGQGILLYEETKGLRTLSNLPAAITSKKINDILPAGNGKVYVATTDGAWKLKIDNDYKFLDVSTISELESLDVRCVSSNYPGTLWFGTSSQGVYYSEDDEPLNHFKNGRSAYNDGLASNQINDISFTSDGSVWLSTPSGLQSWHKSRQRFGIIKSAQPYKSLVYWNHHLVALSDSGISLIGADLKTSAFHRSAAKIEKLKVCGQRLYALSSEGVLEVKVYQDVPMLAKPELFRHVTGRIMDLISTGENEYWISLSDGCVYKVNEQATKRIACAGRADIKLFKGGNNRRYLVSNSQLSIYQAESLVKTISHPAGNLLVNDLHDDGRYVWLALESNGLHRYDTSFSRLTKFSAEKDLSDDNVYDIQPSANNRLWLVSSRGLTMYDSNTGLFKKFYENNGMESHEFVRNGTCMSPDGTIYCASKKGIVRFNPHKWNNNIKGESRIFISKVTIGSTELDRYELASINSSYEMEVDYTVPISLAFAAGINYAATTEPQLFYKLGLMPAQSFQSGSEIHFDGLSPGNKFLHIYLPASENFNEKEIVITIKIVPAWYHQWWFHLSVFALAAVVGYFIYWYRNAQAKKLQLIRSRISQDLHDEVGATLSGISMYSHLTKEQIKSGAVAEIDRSLNVIQHAANDMVTRLNDIVWVVNPKNDSLQKIVEKLVEYSCEIAAAKQIRVRTSISSNISEVKFAMDKRRNIYLLCKEAINNAVKYSGGKNLDLQVFVNESTVDFKVIDDGKGFNEANTKRGNGFESMERRASEIGGRFLLRSKENEGVLVSLRCSKN